MVTGNSGANGLILKPACMYLLRWIGVIVQVPYKYEKALSMSFKKLIIYLITFLSLGMKVFVHGGAATPLPLLDALAKRGQEAQLKNVELIHIHTEAHDKVVSPEFEGN